MVTGSRRQAKIVEGDWFAVPLRGDGWGIGRVARRNASAIPTVVAYLFGPARDARPTLDSVDGLAPGDAVMVRRISGAGLRRGLWPVLGQREWSRDDWPVPAFGHHDDLADTYFERVYSEEDLAPPPIQRPTPKERYEQLPPDGLYGYGVVEIHLAQALGVATAPTPKPPMKQRMEIAHRLALPTREAATAVAQKLEATYRVAVARDDDHWSVTASRDLADSRGLDNEEKALRTLAERHRGRYDGFERGVAER